MEIDKIRHNWVLKQPPDKQWWDFWENLLRKMGIVRAWYVHNQGLYNPFSRMLMFKSDFNSFYYCLQNSVQLPVMYFTFSWRRIENIKMHYMYLSLFAVWFPHHRKTKYQCNKFIIFPDNSGIFLITKIPFEIIISIFSKLEFFHIPFTYESTLLFFKC